jgi:hypothetical protein
MNEYEVFMQLHREIVDELNRRIDALQSRNTKKLPKRQMSDMEFEEHEQICLELRRVINALHDENYECKKKISELESKLAQPRVETVNPDGCFDRGAVRNNLENLKTWIENKANGRALAWVNVLEVIGRIQNIMEKVS